METKLIEVNGKQREHVWSPHTFTGKPYKSDIGTVRYPAVGAWVLTAEESTQIMYERDEMK
jgi:hypothetical protein